jgi:hypothetical protein
MQRAAEEARREASDTCRGSAQRVMAPLGLLAAQVGQVGEGQV